MAALPQLLAQAQAGQPAYLPPRACPTLLQSEGPQSPPESGAPPGREREVLSSLPRHLPSPAPGARAAALLPAPCSLIAF